MFLAGAFAVLYSTVFGATASNARLLADALSLFGVTRYRTPEDRVRWVKIGCVLLPSAFTTAFLVVGEPVTLVFIGALAQGLMLPFLALAALYFRHLRTDVALRPGLTWTLCLWLAAVAMSAVGAYQLAMTVQKMVE